MQLLSEDCIKQGPHVTCHFQLPTSFHMDLWEACQWEASKEYEKLQSHNCKVVVIVRILRKKEKKGEKDKKKKNGVFITICLSQLGHHWEF